MRPYVLRDESNHRESYANDNYTPCVLYDERIWKNEKERKGYQRPLNVGEEESIEIRLRIHRESLRKVYWGEEVEIIGSLERGEERAALNISSSVGRMKKWRNLFTMFRPCAYLSHTYHPPNIISQKSYESEIEIFSSFSLSFIPEIKRD